MGITIEGGHVTVVRLSWLFHPVCLISNYCWGLINAHCVTHKRIPVGYSEMYLKAAHNIFVWALLSKVWVCQAKLPLFFPAASVYQVTASLSVPIVLPYRKLFWDWGLQMNYDVPSKPSSFYDATIWADEFARRDKRQLRNETQKYVNPMLGSLHPGDFTAGELYESVESMLTRYGFDESCLLRSVCELARHPFDDGHQNMLTALLTFTLT